MEKEIVRRRNHRRQKRPKKNRSLRCIQINLLKHHTSQSHKPSFDKSNRSQASSCTNDNERLVTTKLNEFTENTSDHSHLLSLKNEIICVKSLDDLCYKNMILPTSSYTGKKFNAITTIMKKADVPDLDITMLLEIISNVYKKLQILLLQLKLHMIQTYTTPTDKQQTKYLLNIHAKKFITFMSLEYRQKIEETRSQQKMACQQKHKILFKEYKQLKISIEKRCIRFQISMDKFHTFSVNFIQTLVNIQKCVNEDSNTAEKISVPSLYLRNWHIRDTTQGYLLTILLRKHNVAYLNTMRNLYFVIITTVNPNLTIEFNFKLPNGLIMAYDSKSEIETPFETIYFNEEHKQVLDNAPHPHMNTTMLHLEDNRQITENIRMASYSEYSYETVSTVKRQLSLTDVESDSFLSSLSELDSEYFELQSDSQMTTKDSLNTLTYSIDDKFSCQSIFNRKDCGDINFTDFLMDNLRDFNTYYNTTLEQSKTWITNLLQDPNVSNVNLNNFCIINESLFELFSLNYVENIVDNLAHIQLHDFCKLFTKDLGKCTIYTLFNHYPVPVMI